MVAKGIMDFQEDDDTIREMEIERNGKFFTLVAKDPYFFWKVSVKGQSQQPDIFKNQSFTTVRNAEIAIAQYLQKKDSEGVINKNYRKNLGLEE